MARCGSITLGTSSTRMVHAARSWIGAPLAGTTVPMTGITVVAHATDEQGVALVELDVDGVAVARQRFEGAPDPLVAARFDWSSHSQDDRPFDDRQSFAWRMRAVGSGGPGRSSATWHFATAYRCRAVPR